MNAVPPHKPESESSEKPGQHDLDSLETKIRKIDSEIEGSNWTEREKIIIKKLEALLYLIKTRIDDLEKIKEMKTKQLRQI